MKAARTRFSTLFAATTLSALVAANAAHPSRAAACGGFFCSQSGLVNQAAERIVFATDADGRVTMIVEIAYQGPSEKFAWLLPVPGEPAIDVSSAVVFQRLQAATNPSYTLNMRVEGECASDDGLFARGASASGGDLAEDGDVAPQVEVRAEGMAGPYDYVLIAVTDATDMDDPAQLAIDWLGDNGYDVSATAPELLRPYLQDGLNLLAFRLSKGASTGSIRPVQLTFESGLPSIPIRPTAVAATEDMGVMVWVVGDGRAIPKNYKHLELNEALIDWFNPNNTYNQVVSMAADEAMGQGFVTEFAGPGEDLVEQVYADFEREQWDQMRDQSFASGRDAFEVARGTFFGWDGFDQAAAQALTAVGFTDYSATELSQCPECLLEQAQVPADVTLDAIFESVIEPLQKAVELLTSAPRVTRLYTTMSADEMTVDPVFDLNEELPDYSNLHVADWVIECDSSITMDEALWRIELESGDVRGEQQDWPIALDDAPATQRILQLGVRGTGEVVVDNRERIAAAVRSSNARFPSPGGCACRVPGPTSDTPRAPLFATLLLLGLCAARSLRRRA